MKREVFDCDGGREGSYPCERKDVKNAITLKFGTTERHLCKDCAESLFYEMSLLRELSSKSLDYCLCPECTGQFVYTRVIEIIDRKLDCERK